MSDTKEQFLEIARKWIRHVWTKRILPMSPEEEYPRAVSQYINVEIDGEMKTFVVRIHEIKEEIKRLAEIRLEKK